MAIDLYWDDENLTTLLCIFDGRWTWDELRATLKTIKQISEDVEHEVSAIIDIRKGHLADGLAVFSAEGLQFAKEVLKMGKGGTGKIVVVGANRMIMSMFETMRGLDARVTSNVHFVESVRQARETLAREQKVTEL